MSAGTSNPIRYFGQQVRRARRAAGWTLTEFGQRIGYDPGQISRIENGKRPPTELFAQMCDRAFPDRDGWFSEFYAESCTWIATPRWFRNWVEHEQQAATLRIWQLGALSGLLQTEAYARAILAVEPGVTDGEVGARLTARLARQAVLTRDDPPAAWFLVDEATLRRCVGSPDVMAAQLAHLAGLARLPNLTIQVVPNVAHAGLLGGFAVAERTAYVETAVAGQAGLAEAVRRNRRQRPPLLRLGLDHHRRRQPRVPLAADPPEPAHQGPGLLPLPLPAAGPAGHAGEGRRAPLDRRGEFPGQQGPDRAG
jgi:transcriptional regulator with XRE-family HTH domain